MFWKYGGYARVSPLVTLLDKPDVTVEDVLNESDLMQELKQHNTSLIEYLRDDDVLRKLYDIIVSPSLMPNEFDDNDDDETKNKDDPDQQVANAKGSDSQDKETGESGSVGLAEENSTAGARPEDLEAAEKDRLASAYVASEVLASPIWSLIEAMVENEEALRSFWQYLFRSEPLDSLQTSYFVKVNETLLDQKPNAMLAFVMSLDGIIPAMLRHIDNPLVMDLLVKIITMEKGDGDLTVTEWLQLENLIPKVLSFISNDYPPSFQTAAGDFLKALVAISANSAQGEQPCIGPNSLSRQLVSQQCVQTLISSMVQGGNPLTVGVGLIIDIIRKNNPDFDPEVGQCRNLTPTTHDPIYLGTMLTEFTANVPKFMALLELKSEARAGLSTAWGATIEPLGFDRFKTCELMAELLHCSNMGLHNEPGSHSEMIARDAERERLRYEGIQKQEEDSGFVHADGTNEFAEENSVYTDFESSTGGLNTNTSNAEDFDGHEDITSSGVLVENANPFEIAPNGDAKYSVGTFTSVSKFGTGDDFVEEPLTPPERNVTPGTVNKELEADTATRSQDAVVTEEHNIPIKLGEPGTDATVEEPSSSSAADISNKSPDDVEPLPVSEQQEQPTEEVPESPKSRISAVETQDYPGDTDPVENEQTFEEGSDLGGLIQRDPDGHPVVGDYVKLIFLDNKVIPTILSYFFRFRWNNFIHNVVYDIVQQLLNGRTDQGCNKALVINLFETYEITTRIIEAQKFSEESEATTKMRPGNMGHLTLIAEEVVKFSEREPQEVLSQGAMEKLTHPDWLNYVDKALSDIRERENAILGGVKPDVTMTHRQAVLNAIGSGAGTSGPSAALANAGLNGDFPGSGLDFTFGNQASVSGGAFGFGNSGTSLFSGFGSSSDDDDDLEDLRQERTRLTSADHHEDDDDADSQAIPILPPPPSSLSVKPSRARRQLAARLALQKQQATEEAASSSTATTDAADDCDGIQDIDAQDDGSPSETEAVPSFPSAFEKTSDYLSSSSSDDDHNVVESIERKIRLPVDVFDDDDMGDIVGPSSTYSDEEDETEIREALGYSGFFGHDSQSGDVQNSEPSPENQYNSDEDDGLVEILVPGKNSTSS